MTGPELQAIRASLGLGVVEFARAIGFDGNDNTVSVRVRRFEGGRQIPPYIARLAIMFQRFGIPEDFAANGR